ncbi:preprotein translocase subunit SecE [Synechococcus sp. Cruz CV12-2-Slac-r]|nr:preprotein translocase subunit SecE [Synechococcus sp. SupBloom_Metag_053]MCP9940085.1 preprotein translocase subunit SecE [Synechococcus sp. Cruz CV12-2-Slac-r]
MDFCGYTARWRIVVSSQPPSPEGSGPGGWIQSTFAELRRVVWPSRQQLISESVAVLLMVTISAAAIASLDRFFHWLSQLLFR